MTPEIVLVGGIIGATVILLAFEIFRVDVVALLVMVTLVALGLLDAQQALAGFANPATVTVGAMFVLSAGLQHTGAVRTLGRRLVEIAGESERRLHFGLMTVVATISGFINNTAAVAILTPLTLSIARKVEVSPSRLLMPLSFAAMFGGLTTLIGTSTNILVNSIAVERGLPGFTLFEFAPLGVIFILAGILYMMTVGRHLVPDRQAQMTLADRYELRDFLTEVKLLPESPLIGQTVEDVESGPDFDMHIVGIVREDEGIPVPGRNRTLQENDILVISSDVTTLTRLMEAKGWELLPQVAMGDIPTGESEYALAEAVVAPGSALVGETLRTSDFRQEYGLLVIGIQKHGELVRRGLADVPLGDSDVLLLYGDEERLDGLQRDRDFLMLQELPMVPLRSGKAPLALGIVALVVLLAAFDVLPIVASALVGCGLMVVTGVLSAEDAYDALDAKVLVMLAGLLSLGTAMDETGTAGFLAHQAVDFVGPFGPVALVACFYLMSSLFTETMSNNATAVLLAPIVISIAGELGIDAKPLLVAITFAASASFMTPVGYQTNTMIYGPGGYRFTDFTRVGAPLNLLFWVLATVLIPVFWPFQ